MNHTFAEMLELQQIWNELNAQIVGDYIDPTLPTVSFTTVQVKYDPVFAEAREKQLAIERDVMSRTRIGVGQCIREEHLGNVIERFDNIFEGESEAHLEGAIEWLNAPVGMTYHDAVNQSYVY